MCSGTFISKNKSHAISFEKLWDFYVQNLRKLLSCFIKIVLGNRRQFFETIKHQKNIIIESDGNIRLILNENYPIKRKFMLKMKAFKGPFKNQKFL